MCCLTIVLVLAATTALGAGSGPEGVSPGAADRLARTGSTCPTFSWEAVPDAQRYELVAYRLGEDFSSVEALDLETADEALYTTVPGRASSWTPELVDCFTAGERYVWFVRAVTDTETGEGSEWSAPRFFDVAPVPSTDELERAIEVLRRWEEANGNGSLMLSSAADTAPATAPGAVPTAASAADAGPVSDAGSAAPKSVITGTAAIRGEQPDLSGETYGVVGISVSPDGAGIGAANVTGGPDLVLDGAVPAEISESGIDRPSASPQTFSVTNTGGGGMTLDIGGAEVLTTASAVDADTLDGIDGADFATDVEAAALVMTHAASADHDGRYYTETELSASGAGGSVHWNNLGGVPAGFADGIDDDTTYTFGPGLTVHNGQIVLDPAAFSPVVTTLDSDSTVGGTSIAIGADGLGLISYGSSEGVKVAHCENVLCTSATLSTIDGGGVDPSIATGSDGLGLIAYRSVGLKVAHCDDVPCTSATLTTIDGGLNVYTSSVAIGDDGLGLISYFDHSPNLDLKVAHCDNVLCTSATITTVDSVGAVGWYNSIAIGADGLGLISYGDSTNDAIKVAHCDDVLCGSATLSAIASSPEGYGTSIAIGSDGLGIVGHIGLGPGAWVRTYHCSDTLCTTATPMIVDRALAVGLDISVAIGADGFPVIGYFLEHDGEMGHDLKVAHCGDARCGVASTRPVEFAFGPDWWGISIAVGTDGLPLVSFAGGSNPGLRVAHLPYGY